MKTKFSLAPDEVAEALCDFIRMRYNANIRYDEDTTDIKVTAHVTEDAEDNLISIDVWEE